MSPGVSRHAPGGSGLPSTSRSGPPPAGGSRARSCNQGRQDLPEWLPPPPGFGTGRAWVWGRSPLCWLRRPCHPSVRRSSSGIPLAGRLPADERPPERSGPYRTAGPPSAAAVPTAHDHESLPSADYGRHPALCYSNERGSIRAQVTLLVVCPRVETVIFAQREA